MHNEKSIRDANTSIEYLGLVFNSISMTVSLKQKKVDDIYNICCSAVQSKSISLRYLAKILGNFSLALLAVPYAAAHFRYLQSQYNEFFHKEGKELDWTLSLLDESITELIWWKDNIRSVVGRSIADSEPDLVIFSDACLTGWGASMQGLEARGPWLPDECLRHINELEMLAAFNALQSFANNARNVCIHLMIDNSTTVAYLNKCGGTKSENLRLLALKVILWCETRKISLRAFHIAGVCNSIADYLSRNREDMSDWRLHPDLFSRILALWDLKVDLFANHWNAQLPTFVSWHPQPNCLAVNAFTLDWKWLKAYIFPPFSLIQRCLAKTRSDQAEITLVTPFWQTQPWFPAALEMACDFPRMLPRMKSLLTDPSGHPHPLLDTKSFQLIAWRLSGIDSRNEEFLKTCPNCCSMKNDDQLLRRMNHLGALGIDGVSNGKLIPYLGL